VRKTSLLSPPLALVSAFQPAQTVRQFHARPLTPTTATPPPSPTPAATSLAAPFIAVFSSRLVLSEEEEEEYWRG